jgi:signal transduction histidine kinase
MTVIQSTLRGLIATGVLFIIAIGSMGFLSFKLAQVDFWAMHTHKVIETLKDALSALQDVETGERGYLATMDKRFLEPYHRGMETSMGKINEIKSFTEDNQVQQRAVEKLRQIAERKIALATRDVQTGHEEGSTYLNSQLEGKQVMDAFRDQVKVMIGTEQALLDTRVEELRFSQYALWTVTGMLALVGMAILFWVFRITKSGIEFEKRRVTELNEEIEQRIKTEKALKDATVNLARSNADLQQFAYVASHDLQEPLRAVTGFLTLLNSKIGNTLDDDSKKYITHAVEGAHRMRALVNDLLTYARVESRSKEFTAVKLEDVLEQTLSNLSVQVEETHAKVSHDLLPTVLGDATQLGQLFQNLIGNAIKFRSSKAPEIKISVVGQKEDWLFSFQDNGRGFDMEHAERIFVIFQRLQGRDQASGTGIGLALCKKIVERHQGKIWVDSAPDKGSTFFFTLPKLDGEKKQNES